MIGEFRIYDPKDKVLSGWKCHPHDHHYLTDTLTKLPSGFNSGLRRNYSNTYRSLGRREANLSILDIRDAAKSSLIRLTLSDEDLYDKAKGYAKSAARIAASADTQADARNSLTSYFESIGYPLPVSKTCQGMIARASDKRWWRRILRKCMRQSVERVAIQANIVNRKRGIYASDTTVQAVQAQQRRNRALMEEMIVVNELGDEFSLAEISEHSQSNPKVRRAELMVRIRGFEDLANELGHSGMFYTITCPSKMHRSFSHSGEPNPKYSGITPKESQKYLCTLWERARAAFKRRELTPYGIRVCEPQHDGTPHWHLLLFMPVGQAEKITQILQRYALDEDGSEKGAAEHRFEAVEIDKTKGSATGYIAKYVSKNIDGHGLDEDLYGKPASSSSVRVKAWASVWRIRQFQFFGSPPVTVWRELRRLNTEGLDGLIQKAANAADIGDWSTFVRLMGGPGARKKDQRISIFREDRGGINQYGEPKVQSLVGVRLEDELAVSRMHVWVVGRKSDSGMAHILNMAVTSRRRSGAELVSASMRCQPGHRPGAPWSSVNNCTFR